MQRLIPGGLVVAASAAVLMAGQPVAAQPVAGQRLAAAVPTVSAGPYRPDPDSYRPSSTEAVGAGPRGIAGAGTTGVTATSADDSASVFVSCTPKVCGLGYATARAVGRQPSDAVIGLDPGWVTGTAYVSNTGDGTVSAIPLGVPGPPPTTTLTVGGAPTGLALSPDNRWLYVADNSGARLVVVDTSGVVAATSVAVGSGPWGVVVSPDGARAYVANNGSGTVSVVDTTTRTVVGTITVGSRPGEVALDPSGARLAVSNNGDGTISVVDTASSAVTSTIPVGREPWGVAATATHVFVANYADGTVSVVDSRTRRVIATVTVGSQPFGVTSDGAGKVLVSNFGSNSVSAIDLAARGPEVDWSASRHRRAITGRVYASPAVTYSIVARQGSSVRRGTCVSGAKPQDVSCTVRVGRGTWRTSVQARLPWQPVPVGQQNKRFTFP